MSFQDLFVTLKFLIRAWNGRDTLITLLAVDALHCTQRCVCAQKRSIDSETIHMPLGCTGYALLSQ
jgi:hypothetical protein